MWPTTCRVTVRGLPPGVSAKEFYAKLDASVFCRVLMDGRHHDTHIDHERDTWTCELTFNVAPLQWMDLRLMELPEVPMYNPLEFGTPSAYLVLLCWRHVPFLYHLHPSFHHAMVGPGQDQITPFACLFDCVISFCERRLGMYRERHARLVAQREEEVAAQELRVRFYEYMQVLWEEDKSLLRSWCFFLFLAFFHSFSSFLSFFSFLASSLSSFFSLFLPLLSFLPFSLSSSFLPLCLLLSFLSSFLSFLSSFWLSFFSFLPFLPSFFPSSRFSCCFMGILCTAGHACKSG